MSDKYNIVISPETISGDLSKVIYSGQTVGVYSGMSQVVSAGPNGSSILTGLTIPILLNQSTIDMGYYSPFDGDMCQLDVVTNFIFSSTTQTPYTYNIYNTSSQYQKFIELSKYTVDWGDGSPKQTITGYTPETISHLYPQSTKKYTILLEQTNPWGKVQVYKKISVPFKNQTILNPLGRAFFTPNIGSWSATPISYDYIFSGDAVNTVESEVSSGYTTVPFTISSETSSRLSELTPYGNFTPQQRIGLPIIKGGEIFGTITNISPIFTAYTIQDVDYYDYSNGLTLSFTSSSGFTSENIVAVPITKDESLMKIIDQGQIQTNVFIERGKNSAFERVQRLGEVDNLGDLENYGYGFFNVEEKGRTNNP
jgi:hypothetical protein